MLFLADLLQIKSEAPAWFSCVRPQWQMHKQLSSLCVFPSTKPPFLALLIAGTADLLQLSIGSGSQKIPQRSEMGGKETGVSACTPRRASSRYQCVLGTHFLPSSAQGQKVCQSVGSQHLLMSSDPANTCLVKSFHFTWVWFLSSYDPTNLHQYKICVLRTNTSNILYSFVEPLIVYL